MGRKKISQTEEERKARMKHLRTKEGIIGDKFASVRKSVESVRDMMKDICRVKGDMYSVDLKDVYIRAVLGSEQLIDRLYFYIQNSKGSMSPNRTVIQQLANEMQFHDWLVDKLNDIDLAEYQAMVQYFGDAKEPTKPVRHGGSYSKEERLNIEKWNWFHPEDPFYTRVVIPKPKIR